MAGYNSKSGVITLESANGNVYGITVTGGVAGYNLGTITARSVTVKVSGTTQTGGVAGLNAASGTIGIDPYASGSYAMTIEAATTVSSSDNGGGVAGRNEGLVQYVTNNSGSIQVINEYAGGIAGSNKGKIGLSASTAPPAAVFCTLAAVLPAASPAVTKRTEYCRMTR